MSAFTSKAAGNWSASGQTTWNEVGVPGSGDTVTITHNLTVDVDTTIGIGGGAGVRALTIVNAGGAGSLVVAAGKKLTLKGDVRQGNGNFILGAGSELIFDTTGGNRKWLQGDGSASHLDNVYVIANGTSGSHAKIHKTGANYCWFDGFDEASGAYGQTDSTGWDLTYCDLSDIGRHDGVAANTFSIRLNDPSHHHFRFQYCTFDLCDPLTGIWHSDNNFDFQIEHCKFTNSYGWDFFGAPIKCLKLSVGGTGSGLRTYKFNSVDGGIFVVFNLVIMEDNYFSNTPQFAQFPFGSQLRNTFRWESGPSLQLTGNVTDTYFLEDLVDQSSRILGVSGVGNPHVLFLQDSNVTVDGCVIDYPQDLLVDNGDGFYGQDARPGPPGAITIKNCIIVPSVTDGVASASLHSMGHGDASAKIIHNTVVGRQAQLVFTERDHTAEGNNISEIKSNIVDADGQTDTGAEADHSLWGCVFEDIFIASNGAVNTVTPSGIKNNYINNGRIYTEDVSPGNGTRHDGYQCRLTSLPDGTNIAEVGAPNGPLFLDRTRCAVTWAVYKGYVGAAPAKPALPINRGDAGWIAWLTWKRSALDAVNTALMNDPTLGHGDLLPWVKAGFAPQYAILQNAGHDGVTIGAVEFYGGAPPPPPATKFFKALGR